VDFLVLVFFLIHLLSLVWLFNVFLIHVVGNVNFLTNLKLALTLGQYNIVSCVFVLIPFFNNSSIFFPTPFEMIIKYVALHEVEEPFGIL